MNKDLELIPCFVLFYFILIQVILISLQTAVIKQTSIIGAE